MQIALEQAKIASSKGEVPVGAVIASSSEKMLITAAHNMTENKYDPTAHAEILAIRRACSILSATRLVGYDLYVTLEPCPMCAQAISHARLGRVYFGAYDAKGGGVENGARIFSAPSCHHTPEIYGGILEEESKSLLRDFFYRLR